MEKILNYINGELVEPINGSYLCKATMYFVRWNDDQDLSGDSVLFTKAVSPNVCVIRHVCRQRLFSPLSDSAVGQPFRCV